GTGAVGADRSGGDRICGRRRDRGLGAGGGGGAGEGGIDRGVRGRRVPSAPAGHAGGGRDAHGADRRIPWFDRLEHQDRRPRAAGFFFQNGSDNQGGNGTVPQGKKSQPKA